MRYNNDTGGADRVPGCGSGAGRMAGARLRTGPPGQPGASAAPAEPPCANSRTRRVQPLKTGRGLRGGRPPARRRRAEGAHRETHL